MNDYICDDRRDYESLTVKINNMTDEEFDSYLIKLTASELIDRLNLGENIICRTCGKGKYVAPEGAIEKSRSYRCEVCGEFLHITPEFTVE